MHYRFGEFELDTTRELLTGPDGDVALRPLTWRLLRHMVEHANVLVTQDELMNSVWGHNEVTPNVVTQTLSELRQVLGDNAQNPRFIETRPRRGFAFIAPVTIIEDAITTDYSASNDAAASARAVESLSTTNLRTDSTSSTSSAPAPLVTRPGWRRPAFLGSAIAVLLLVIVGMLLFTGGNDDGMAPTASLRPLVVVKADSEFGDLAALTRLMLRDGDELVVPAPGSPEMATTAGTTAASLDIKPDGHWTIAGDDGKSLAVGVLAGTSAATQAHELNAAVRKALNVRDRSGPRAGWPRDDAALAELGAAMSAFERGRLDQAIPKFQNALSDLDASSLPRLMLARALAQAGDWKDAQSMLGDASPTAIGASTPSALLVDALRARLRGARDASLAALRAYRHLVPNDIDSGLLLLDAQMQQRQWTAATATLSDFKARSDATNSGALALWEARLAAGQRHDAQALQLLKPLLPEAGEPELSRMAVDALALHADLQQRAGRGLDALRDLESLATADTPKLALAQGRIAREAGQIDTAVAAFERAAKGFSASGLIGERRRAQLERAYLQLDRGEPGAARDSMVALLQQAVAAGEPSLLVDIHTALGLALINVGDLDGAGRSLEQAVAVADQSDDPSRRARALLNLGILHVQQGRLADAGTTFDRASNDFREIGDARGEATAMANLGALSVRAGRLEQARKAYGVALQRQRQLGGVMEVGRIAFNLGLVEREHGDLDTAAKHFDEAFGALQKTDAIDFLLQTAASRAELELMRGNADGAKAALAAISQHKDQGSPMRRAALHAANGRIAEFAGDWAAARARYQQARALRETTGARAWVLVTDLALLRLDMRESPKSTRLRVRSESLEAELTRMDEGRDAISAALTTAESLMASGDTAATSALLDRIQAAVQTRGNRQQQHHAAWVAAKISSGDERDERLLRLVDACEAGGFHAIAMLARAGREADGSPELREQTRELETRHLGGIFAAPSAAFQ